MTTKEAREIYLKSDCSYFLMCTNYYSEYMEYRKLEITQDQEIEWKNEKIQMLYAEIRKTGSDRLFYKLFNIAVEFRDFEKLRIVTHALKCIKEPLKPDQRVSLAETILGRKSTKVRSGLIYWAYDNGQRGIAILLMDMVLEYLNLPNVTSIELNKRIQKERRLCKKIIAELHLNFSKRYLKHYYDF